MAGNLHLEWQCSYNKKILEEKNKLSIIFLEYSWLTLENKYTSLHISKWQGTRK